MTFESKALHLAIMVRASRLLRILNALDIDLRLTQLNRVRPTLEDLAAEDRTIEQAADVLAKLAPEVAKYFNENSVHREIGGRLLAAWQTGIRESLGFAKVALI